MSWGRLVNTMAKHPRTTDPGPWPPHQVGSCSDTARLPREYRLARKLAARGRHDKARRLYARLEPSAAETRLRALIANDLAVLAAVGGDFEAARESLEAALAIDEGCQPARLNLALLRVELSDSETVTLPANGAVHATALAPSSAVKIAIVSFLFNWPSTGGGNIHTVELATFLARAGYEVKHFHARYANWGIGRVTDELPIDSSPLQFNDWNWNISAIQARFREAVDAFAPDYVLITDTWNMKPILAEAVRGYHYLLRFQAQECLCPLNNLRLLLGGPGEFAQCSLNQLATPDVCRRCLAERGDQSGLLHQQERALAGVGTPEYDRKLHRALNEAEAVLALNPLTAALLEAYSRQVSVVPWGMDPARFPWPQGDEARDRQPSGITTLFMAAVAGELMKGFHIAHEACRLLRQSRSDFELVVTFDPPGQIDEFTRSVGWCSQAELPQHYRTSDICLVPTIAQEGLSRTSVEAMASGIPVIASRIGGLPYTVVDGVTGLLFEPGDAVDLARKITRMLDDPLLRKQMGLAGRQRFENEFTWETVIERYYRPLLTRRVEKQPS